MNYYKNYNNEIFAYEDTQTPLDGLVSITEAEKDAILLARKNEYKQSKEYLAAEARVYLAATDWYVIRKTERDIAIPEEVATKRLEAVEVLNGINN